MRAAFDEGLPLIILLENGFTDLAKPGGQRMEACSRGQLLLLAPWGHHNERLTIRRDQCLALNDMSRLICERREPEDFKHPEDSSSHPIGRFAICFLLNEVRILKFFAADMCAKNREKHRNQGFVHHF